MTCKHSLTPGVSADGDRAPPAGRMTRREFVSHATTVALGMSASSTAAGGGNAATVQAGVSPIVLMSAIELANAIRSRTLSCTEVMSAYLDHVGRGGPPGCLIEQTGGSPAGLDKGDLRDGGARKQGRGEQDGKKKVLHRGPSDRIRN